MKSMKKHKVYYLFLSLILISGLILFQVLSPNRQMQAMAFVLVSFSYFAVGIVHHKQEHDFHPKIMIEYALIASLGITCILFMLKVGLGL